MSTVDDTSVLSPAEIEAVTALARQYEARRGACIEALRIVQRSHGWISDERLREVARLLEMSADELDGVATFYNLIFRRPVGRHVILICDSVSCWIMGYETLRDAFHTLLGVQTLASPGGITGPQLTFRKCVMRVSMSCIVWSLSGGVVRGCRDL